MGASPGYPNCPQGKRAKRISLQCEPTCQRSAARTCSELLVLDNVSKGQADSLRSLALRAIGVTGASALRLGLRKYFLNHFAFDVRQAALDAVVFEAEFIVAESEQMENRGVEVIERMNIFNCPLA